MDELMRENAQGIVPEQMNVDLINLTEPSVSATQGNSSNSSLSNVGAGSTIQQLFFILLRQENAQLLREQHQLQRALLQAILASRPRTPEEFFAVLRTLLQTHNRQKGKRKLYFCIFQVINH